LINTVTEAFLSRIKRFSAEDLVRAAEQNFNICSVISDDVLRYLSVIMLAKVVGYKLKTSDVLECLRRSRPDLYKVIVENRMVRDWLSANIRDINRKIL